MADDIFNKELVRDTVRAHVDSTMQDGFPRGYRSMICLAEECAELTQQATKYLRGKFDKVGMLEELGDNILNVFYVMEICGITEEEVIKALNAKVQNLGEIVEHNKTELYL